MTESGPLTFSCGPLEIVVTSESDVLRSKVAETLELYNVSWTGARTRWSVDIRSADKPAQSAAGAYLECARMNVDPSSGNDGLVATCPSGISATSSRAGRRWSIAAPGDHGDPWVLTDMESLLSLVLTEGWRSAGWTPVHAATIIRDDICAIICAASGGGKTTLTAAFIRRGWKTLGDDKLLLRVCDGRPELRALVHTFNLHPQTRSWFPEVGDLTRLPAYSEWTEKRKVRPESIWPGTTVDCATPNFLLQIDRASDHRGVSVEAMAADDVLSTLLRQTVIPSRTGEAKASLSTVVATARQLSGLKVLMGDDAYTNAEFIGQLETALEVRARAQLNVAR